MTPPSELAPARLLPRYLAWSLDAACLLPLLWLLGAGPLRQALGQADAAWQALCIAMFKLLDNALVQGQPPLQLAWSALADPRLRADIDQLESALTQLLLIPPLLYAGLALPWTWLFETSAWQATPGKRALGLRVVDAGGARLSWRRVLLRFLASGLSWLTLNFGHAMAGWPPHLALHDHLSRTRVLATSPPRPVPRWARAWLALQALLLVVAAAWLYHAAQGAMQAAMAQALGPL